MGKEASSAMEVTTLLVTLLLVVSVLESEGSITGAAGPQGCTTTCCMTCQLGDNCDICYKLNPPDSLHCPCLDSLTLPELRRLVQLPLSLHQLRGEGGEGGDCVPSCCPSMTCSESSCPLCYRRHRAAPDKCPCSKW